MSNTHKLEVLKCLIRAYFSEKLQHDENPSAAKTRKDILTQILTLAEE